MKDHIPQPLEDLPIPPTRMLEESPNGWILTDPRGKICFANARASELFQYTREELLGQPVEILIPEASRRNHVAERKAYMQEPVMRPMGMGLELTARRKDGSVFPVEISLSPMPTPRGTYVTAIIKDITERVELEEERNNLRLELGMQRERDRIGMDLHDGIMQEVYAAGLTLELALADVWERPDAAEAEIERGIEQLHAVIRNIRSYIFDLRPREYGGSLTSALTELAREFRQNTLIAVTEAVEEISAEVNDEHATAAYHIVHEALSNVRKHARASEVSLVVRQDDGQVVIEVRDNGRGFDPEAEIPQVHRGLRNMGVRARESGVALRVESSAGEGTCIQVQIPVRP